MLSSWRYQEPSSGRSCCRLAHGPVDITTSSPYRPHPHPIPIHPHHPRQITGNTARRDFTDSLHPHRSHPVCFEIWPTRRRYALQNIYHPEHSIVLNLPIASWIEKKYFNYVDPFIFQSVSCYLHC